MKSAAAINIASQKGIAIDHPNVSSMIRDRLVSGRLPYDSSLCVWGGASLEVTCDACDEVVMKPQLLMAGISKTGRGIRMHVACFSLWDAARRASSAIPSLPS